MVTGKCTLFSFYEKEEFEIIFQHEKQHSMLLHSLDILFVELYNIFFWINPISWIIKKEIRCVHEYECDQKTLGSILTSTLGHPKSKAEHFCKFSLTFV